MQAVFAKFYRLHHGSGAQNMILSGFQHVGGTRAACSWVAAAFLRDQLRDHVFLTHPRLLIIGTSKFLGQCSKPIWQSPRKGRLAMDVTSAASVNAGFNRAVLDVAILLAAISEIDECKRRSELALGGEWAWSRICCRGRVHNSVSQVRQPPHPSTDDGGIHGLLD
jgi:hypothetical protein